ncbi:hypothetical protein GCM10018789_64080 [Streptomyces werraensis]|nr:hypothetical protein GCM10018789_64080 [Streptomyces werraensis]
MFHVREADLLKAVGATAGVLEVHLLEPFGGDLHETPLVGSLLLRVEEPGGVLRGKGDSQLTQTCVVGGADGSGVADAGAGVDDDAVGGRRPLPRPGADLGFLTSVGVEAGAEGRERAVRAADDPVSRSGCGPGDACGAEADAPPADGYCGGTPTVAPEGAAAASAPEVSRDSEGPGGSAG